MSEIKIKKWNVKSKFIKNCWFWWFNFVFTIVNLFSKFKLDNWLNLSNYLLVVKTVKFIVLWVGDGRRRDVRFMTTDIQNISNQITYRKKYKSLYNNLCVVELVCNRKSMFEIGRTTHSESDSFLAHFEWTKRLQIRLIRPIASQKGLFWPEKNFLLQCLENNIVDFFLGK